MGVYHTRTPTHRYLCPLQDLISDLKSELSGKLEKVVLALMDPVPLYNAKCLRAAMKVCGGWGVFVHACV